MNKFEVFFSDLSEMTVHCNKRHVLHANKSRLCGRGHNTTILVGSVQNLCVSVLCALISHQNYFIPRRYITLGHFRYTGNIPSTAIS